ncbi:MAG TPA: sulfotransferase, partial [Rubrobacter sp.]|nr:sulfotransferase [Rubrobacter sp.]
MSTSRYRDALRSLREGSARLGSTVERLRVRLGRRSPNGTAFRGGEVPVFFVVGLAKSGTTWLMKTLDAHPEVLCRGEGRFFGEEYRR